MAAAMWTKLTGQPVDGVLSLDVAGLRQLLEATGPVQADGQTVSADNVEQFLLHDQYNGLTDDATGDGSRQDALGSLTGAVLRQLQGQSLDIKALSSAVSSAVAGRHLMVWSKNPVDQAAWVVSGVSGEPHPPFGRRVGHQPGRQQAGPVPAGARGRDHRPGRGRHHGHPDHHAWTTPRPAASRSSSPGPSPGSR